MKQWIRKMYESSVIRYIFFGGCTTMVNLVSFFILRKLKVELNIANIISIILAILFCLCGKFEVCFFRINARH